MDCVNARAALNSTPSPEAWEHVRQCPACIERYVVQTLDAPPAVKVPGEFASRVAASLPPREPAPPSLRSITPAVPVFLLVLTLAAAAFSAAVRPEHLFLLAVLAALEVAVILVALSSAR